MTAKAPVEAEGIATFECGECGYLWNLKLKRSELEKLKKCARCGREAARFCPTVRHKPKPAPQTDPPEVPAVLTQ